MIPLAPYFAIAAAARALTVSVALTLRALFVFGDVKGHFTGAKPILSALQTALVGGLAAAAAFVIARAIAWMDAQVVRDTWSDIQPKR